MVLRNVIRAFIHGVFIEIYHYQILSLAIVDVVFVVISVLFLRYYINKALFLFFLAYQLSVLIMDSTFFIYQLNPTLFGSIFYDSYIFILICIIILSALLLSVAILFSTVKQIVFKYTNIFKSKEDERRQR